MRDHEDNTRCSQDRKVISLLPFEKLEKVERRRRTHRGREKET